MIIRCWTATTKLVLVASVASSSIWGGNSRRADGTGGIYSRRDQHDIPLTPPQTLRHLPLR